jgi:hypothetical protein
MAFFATREQKRTNDTRRTDTRFTTYGIVEIHDEKGVPLATGTSRDISKTGALIKLEKPQALPDVVSLWFVSEKFERMAKIRWRKDDSIGVEFDDEIQLPARLVSKRDRRAVVAAHFAPTQAR